MTGLEFMRKDVIGLIENKRDVFSEYEVPAECRSDVYASAAVEEIIFEDLLICEDVKTYDVRIKVRVSVFGQPDMNPGRLYDMTDSKIIDVFAKSGYSLEKVTVGRVNQNPKLGRMVLETEIILGARTAAV
ncbi:MAG: hypothetical protein ACI4I9_05165 [Porcipelethomonas sp.]